ncbi:hypothetical protein SAMN02745163_02024 [Clostridium cavendishii DSM 21758]|uniref:WD40 repeat n=1 Tax=Clostridium cavendishii DSM 21758 TaxID=1121302 RepID=A0A1M6JG78_9CLOT|nr:hypothetical protein [Clostridium cavendishii]SHJ45728.1 hypothetical protein SAMN02745163_02024 [Clostridium cavendishii DSM 21758]
MIHKLGLNKDNAIKNFYFKKLEVDLNVDNADDKINVISASINSKITSVDIDTSLYLDKTLISLQFFLGYKILYNLKGKNSVFVLRDESFHIVEFWRKNYIDGYSIEELILNNSMKVEIKINNIDIEIKEKGITITSYLIFSLICDKQYSLAFVGFNENGGNNIFLASNDMAKILQKTFSNNITYKDVSFIKNTQDICYLSNEDGNFSLYILGIRSLISKKVFKDINIDEIISFSLIGGNNVIFLAKTIEGINLCKGNLRNGTFIKLTNIVNEDNNVQFLMNKRTNSIYYFKTLKEKSIIYELKNNNFKVELINIEGQVFWCDIDNSNSIIGLVSLDSKINIFIYKNNIVYNAIPDYIEEIVKVSIAKFSNLIYMLCKSKNESLILIYDIEKKNFRKINYKLNLYKAYDFVLSPSEEEMFYTADGNEGLNIYNLNLKTLENNFLVSVPNTNLNLYYKS